MYRLLGDFQHLRRTARQGLSLVLVAAMVASFPVWAKALSAPPATRTDNVVDTLHGVEIVDHYRWLEEQKSPETREWIAAQNSYMRSILDSLPGREKLASRIAQLYKIDRVGMPTERNGRYFFSRRLADQDQFVIYMREGITGTDEVLIDPHPMSPDHSVSVGLWGVSDDGKAIAYAVRQGGEDEEVVRLFDVEKRQDLPDSLPRAVYFGLSLMKDMSGFYYTLRTENGPRVYYHVLGTDLADDKLIFGEEYGPEMIVSCDISDNGRWLWLYVFYGSSGKKTEIYIQDLEKKGPIVPLVNDIDARFYGTDAGDRVYLRTDWDAPNYRILVADLQNPARENWQEVIPTSEAVIRGFSAVGGKLCVNYLHNVQSSVKIYEPDGKFIREISFPSIGTVSGLYGRWERDEAFFAYSSFHIPSTIFRYDLAQDTREIWARLDVPVDTDNFEVKQVWCTSQDSTRVPMFIVHTKGIKLDGSNPTLMYGYGGFNASLTPYFSSWAVIWIEHGGVYVSANLRGGGEFGQEWHHAAMFEKKQNTFDDFYAVAEYLINQGYTAPEKLAISGGSNGGLLVGAALTQRPELFRAVRCGYPLLDMVRFHKFLMGPYWVSEYGSADDPEQFEYLYEYSPYHNVRPGTKYPAVMFVSGDSDTRVDPLHARKMAALLQAATGSEKPVLLHYDTKAGHSGGTPVSKQIEEATDQLHFLLWQVGAMPR